MASEYHNVNLKCFKEDTSSYEQIDSNLLVKIQYTRCEPQFTISFFKGKESIKIVTLPGSANWDSCQLGKKSLNLYCFESGSYLLTFPTENDLTTFQRKLQDLSKECVGNSSSSNSQDGSSGKMSLFDKRTDHWSAVQYFQFYSFLSQQQNMMQDYIRTATYQRAVLSNIPDFQNKVVVDVGAGSGILSFFAVQAGARRVYAVEASNMAEHCEQLIRGNKLAGKIIVVSGKVEEIEIPEPVDLIISEPMGYMLFNERMLESYIHARKFLRNDGKMFPTVANLYVAPFADEQLFVEQLSKANFWYQTSFHGVNLSNLRDAAVTEYFRQPVVDTFDIGICVAAAHAFKVDFLTAREQDLLTIDIPVTFTITASGSIHGLAFWFDVGFIGSQREVWLSTAPTEPLTHWYQVRCLFVTPLFVLEGQVVSGRVLMKSNTRQSYDVEIDLGIPGTTAKVANTLDLKNPYFRYTGVAPQAPPGNQTTSPTEAYYAKIMAGSNSENMTSHLSHQGTNGDSIVLNGCAEMLHHHTDGVAPPLNISPEFMIGDYAANQPQFVNQMTTTPTSAFHQQTY